MKRNISGYIPSSESSTQTGVSMDSGEHDKL